MARHVTNVVMTSLLAIMSMPAHAQDFVDRDVIVIFREGTPEFVAHDIIASSGYDLVDYIDLFAMGLVVIPEGETVFGAVAVLEGQGGPIEGANPNYIYDAAGHLTEPDDAFFSRQWALNNTGDNLVGATGQAGWTITNAVGKIDADIDAPQAWEHGTDCSDFVIVVMDSGIDITHPDLDDNLYINPLETGGDSDDDDGNGWVDDVNGADFTSRVQHTNEDGDGLYLAPEGIYLDVDGSKTATCFDIRVTEVTVGDETHPAGSTVELFDNDFNHKLSQFAHGHVKPGAIDHHIRMFDVGENWVISAMDDLYDDLDDDNTVSDGDRRLTNVNIDETGVIEYKKDTIVDDNDGDPDDADIGRALRKIEHSTGLLTDFTGHGTGVAGVIGAEGDNGMGIAGVCWNARLLGLRVAHRNPQGKGEAHGWRIAHAAAYVAGMHDRAADPVDIRIVNLSYGNHGIALSKSLERAINKLSQRDILFVTGAGNDSIDVDGASGPCYPCSYAPTIDNVLCVAASDNQDKLATTSSYGTTSVDLFAPGVDILTLHPGDLYHYKSGTSYATPHVSGIAAHLWSMFPDYSMTQIRERLLTGKHGPIDIEHPDGVDPVETLKMKVKEGRDGDARARMAAGDDFGDAPDAAYHTLHASNGPRHEDIGEEWLGRPTFYFTWWPPPFFGVSDGDVSPEFDARNDAAWPPDPDGFGNDSSDRFDDGVRVIGGAPPWSTPIIGRDMRIIVYLNTESATVVDSDDGRYKDTFLWVNAWVDWNRDLDWKDDDEHVFMLRVDPTQWNGDTASYDIKFNVPIEPPEVSLNKQWVRVRVDYGENAGQELTVPPHVIGDGGRVKRWHDERGLPDDTLADPKAHLYASIPIEHANHLDLFRGIAQFGEVEDYSGNLIIGCHFGIPHAEEECGQDTDGGCNNEPPTSAPLNCGEMVCGTAWADGGIRDTDWYEINVLDDDGDGFATIAATLESSFPGLVHIIDATDCDNFIVLALAESENFSPGTAVACVPAPGVYQVAVATGTLDGDIFDGLPCAGDDSVYQLSVACADPGACGGPINDECDNAVPVFNGFTTFNTIDATTDGPPIFACETFDDPQVGSDIWFTYEATCTGLLTVDTCGEANYDTRLALYSGDCGFLDLLACNDDAKGCPALTSEVSTEVECGNSYLIRVGGYMAAQGLGTLTVSCQGDCPQLFPEDLNGDGFVNAADLAILLGAWGPCAGCPADLNGDGIVNAADLAQMLGAWG